MLTLNFAMPKRIHVVFPFLVTFSFGAHAIKNYLKQGFQRALVNMSSPHLLKKKDKQFQFFIFYMRFLISILLFMLICLENCFARGFLIKQFYFNLFHMYVLYLKE